MDLGTFKLRSLKAFRTANPGILPAIEWVEAKAVTFPTGRGGFLGTFIARAEGFRTREMRASWVEGGGLMVR